MKRSEHRTRIIASVIAIAVLVAAAVVWVEAVERWIGHELRELAASRLNPTFSYDDLTYTFPSSVTLRGVRLTSTDPQAPGKPIDIVKVDSLTLVLSEIPRPEEPFRMQKLEFVGPTIHFVRLSAGEASGRLLGFSDLLKEESAPATDPASPPARLSEFFQVRMVSIGNGSVLFDPRDGSAPVMRIDGIVAKLLLQPEDAGAYDVDFSLDHTPALRLALRGRALADDKRLELDSLSCTLQLERDQDHYLTPSVQKLLARRDLTGHLNVAATGMLSLDDPASSHLRAHLELSAGGFALGDYALELDRVDSRIAVAGKTVTIEELAIEALGGRASVGGKLELDDSLTGALSFEGTDLQIGDLLRRAGDSRGAPAFSGLLGFSGTLRGPLADSDRQAQGAGQLRLRKARLARLPVLSTIDEALDRAAEASMKREHTGHDQLSLDFSFDEEHVGIEKLRMNSRWYGLRGGGGIYSDSRLDMTVEGGPVERAENELDSVGDLLGELTQTLVRARVTGTLGEPKVGIEVLRHHFR